jgi:phosphopentomutase
MYKRIFTIVIDSVGCGEAPKSYLYGDKNVNTIGNLARAVGGINMPTMQKMGLGNITDIMGVEPTNNPIASFGKMDELSNGKDTMTGHWEIMGLEVKTPFLTFSEHGFPQELVDELEKQTGYKMIGNKSASGTAILDELGEEHMRTKALILYTSADSVLQLAAHEETFGVEELYRCCKIAREITMKPEWMVGRVIARTFIGNPTDGYTRTPNRHDYALAPFGKTVLNTLKDNDLSVIGIGKISDIYNGSGITESHRNLSNHHGMEQIINFAEKDFTGLCFLNLVDFDAAYGHRRDPQGYAKCLEEFDVQLAEFLEKITEEDLVIITADHGNDPTAPGSDHTREYVPLVVYRKNGKNINLGTRTSFADIGATIAENFNLEMPEIGKSFLNEI